MPKSRKDLSGYTLIEIMVVIAIIGFVSSLVLTGLNNQRAQKQTESSAREVEGLIREVQGYALTGKQIVPNSEPCSYQVSWSGVTYNFTYNYKSGGSCASPSTQAASYTLKDGVTFTGSGSFYFTPPHATPSFTGTRGITLGKAGVTKIVCTFSDGLVKEGATCP